MLGSAVSSDDEYRKRFNLEADMVATLSNPHIVTIYDRGEFDDKLWIAMEFIDGTDASRLLAERYPYGMPPDEVVRIITGVARRWTMRTAAACCTVTSNPPTSCWVCQAPATSESCSQTSELRAGWASRAT